MLPHVSNSSSTCAVLLYLSLDQTWWSGLFMVFTSFCVELVVSYSTRSSWKRAEGSADTSARSHSAFVEQISFVVGQAQMSMWKVTELHEQKGWTTEVKSRSSKVQQAPKNTNWGPSGFSNAPRRSGPSSSLIIMRKTSALFKILLGTCLPPLACVLMTLIWSLFSTRNEVVWHAVVCVGLVKREDFRFKCGYSTELKPGEWRQIISITELKCVLSQ